MRLRPPRAQRTTVNPEYGETLVYSGWGSVLPWLWPWFVGPVLLGLAGLLRGMWAGRPWALVALTLATTGLAMLAYRSGRARGPLIRAGAVVGVAAAGTWVIAAVIAGPFTRPVLDFWVLGCLFGGMGTNLMRALRGDGMDGNGGWQNLGEYLGLPGSRTLSTRRDGERIRTVVEVAPGLQTQDDVVDNADRIASVFAVPANGVRVSPDLGNARRANVTIVPRDLLKEPTLWPGPSALGASIMEPIALGIRENGEPLNLWLPGDERAGRSATGVLITGMMGSGKSVAGRILVAEATTRVDVDVTLIDTVKGSQFAGPFRDHIRLIGDEDEAKALISSLPALITARADELGARDLDQWVPGCGMPYLIYHIEEAAAGLAKYQPLVTVAQTCRSAGISLVVSLQRATHHNMLTDLRQQLGARLAFGCLEGDQAYGLSKETVQAGAAPQQWANRMPGYCYAEVPGSDMAEWASPARTYLATLGAVRAALGPGLGVATEQPPAAVEPRILLRQRVEALRVGGADELRPMDLADVLAQARRSPAWLSGELAQLVEAGVLVGAGRGLYRFGQ